MTKKTLVATVVFVFLLISKVWATPPKGALMDDYISKRYVAISNGNSGYYIDFKQVTAVLWDDNGHVSQSLAAVDKGTWGKNYFWIIFNNGTYVVAPQQTPSPAHHWAAYKDFLKDNPQFFSIP